MMLLMYLKSRGYSDKKGNYIRCSENISKKCVKVTESKKREVVELEPGVRQTTEVITVIRTVKGIHYGGTDINLLMF